MTLTERKLRSHSVPTSLSESCPPPVRKSFHSLASDSLTTGASPAQRFLPSAARSHVTALTLMAVDTATLQDTLVELAGGVAISHMARGGVSRLAQC